MVGKVLVEIVGSGASKQNASRFHPIVIDFALNAMLDWNKILFRGHSPLSPE